MPSKSFCCDFQLLCTALFYQTPCLLALIHNGMASRRDQRPMVGLGQARCLGASVPALMLLTGSSSAPQGHQQQRKRGAPIHNPLASIAIPSLLLLPYGQ
jgi:hypothetical protein